MAALSDSRFRRARTRWWRIAPAAWQAGGGWETVESAATTILRASPDGATTVGGRLVEGSLAWLRGADGVRRVRFKLRLSDGERIIGFGERYDRLDQRGNRLDVRV